MHVTLIALSGMLALARANPIVENIGKRDVIGALDESADQSQIDVQSLLDFDSDGCYQTSAIDKDGKDLLTNLGACRPILGMAPPARDCRDAHQLDNANSYSRKRCNNGICVIMYKTYYEKDQALAGSFLGGHRHDWENIVVFTRGNDVVRVALSCHGKYDNARNDFPLRDRHPLLVYHKDGAGTHCYRFANDDDVAHPENPRWDFFRAPLVGWDRWPSVALRNKMLDAWKGGVGPKLDDEFEGALREVAGDGVHGFDPAKDE
ncbi:hypothetical protein ACQRIT_002854 [Beauveria bassiana]